MKLLMKSLQPFFGVSVNAADAIATCVHENA